MPRARIGSRVRVSANAKASAPFGPNFVRVPSPGPLTSASTILDASGNPYRKPIDPLRPVDASRAAQVFRDIAISNSIELDWTPQMVRSALNEHAIGLFASSALLIDAMLGHARIQGALGARHGALFGLPEIYDQAPADTDGECMGAWREAWGKCAAPIGQGDVVDEIRTQALMAGFCVCEITWDTEVTPWQPYLKPWPLQLMTWNPVKRCLMANTEDGQVEVTPGDGRWFVHAPAGIHRARVAGLLRPLALPWLLYMLSARDWARYSERHGMPILLAKTPAVADAEDKQRFEDGLVTMGSEAVVILPQGLDGEGFDVELLEAASQSWEGFDRLLTRCDSTITIAIQWQNLTTEVKEGSQAAARVHGDVKQTAVVYDDRVWADDVQAQVARPFALWNYGDARKAPRVHRDVQVLDDKLAELQALESFTRAVASLRQSGDPVDLEKLAQSYRVRLPLGSARTSQPTIFAYHLQAGIVRLNEARERLGLPAVTGPEGDAFVGATDPAAAPPSTSTSEDNGQ